MCSGQEQSNSGSSTNQKTTDFESNKMKDTSNLSVETEDSFSSVLEFAANNDLESFKRYIEFDLSAVDETGSWFVRKKGAKQIREEERTPLMVAATYGSVDVLKLIVALPEVDLNKSCGKDKWTALHCAAYGGSIHACDVVKLLLSAGADPNVEDIDGCRPVDVVVTPPKLLGARAALEELLLNNISDGSVGEGNNVVSVCSSNVSSPILSSNQEDISPSSPSNYISTPTALKSSDVPANIVSEKKQYPVDPSLPDIRNSIYSTDEFRMFSFKVRPCSRAYSHDWTECPFVHPGENARRRDPRKFHYSCVPCPDFRRGACRRGDLCEYAHGVFECWLHPAQYRTRLCKDGTSCARQVCFFAHAQDELRPLYGSTGSGVPSPISTASAASFMDMATALSFLPGSPSSHTVISPVFNPNVSPTANGMSHSSAPWPQPNVPTLSLPGSNLQSSRLRSSLCARDIPREEFNLLQDFDAQQLVMNDLACFSQPHPNSALLNRSVVRSKSYLTPSNLEDLFMAEHALSPRFSSDQAANSGVFSPTHKSAVLNQFQQQQNILSPINTKSFSPRNVEHPLLQASLGFPSPRMSPRSVESASQMCAHFSAFEHREKQQLQMCSLSSRDLGSNRAPTIGSPVTALSTWGSPIEKADWSSLSGNNHIYLNRSFELGIDGEEPDLSWVQSLVKESPPEMMEKPVAASVAGSAVTFGECLKSNSEIESIDHLVIGAWLEQMQHDQVVA